MRSLEQTARPQTLGILTFDETMRELKIGRDALRALIRKRRIRFVRIGLRYRFRREWIEQFLEKG